MAILVKILKLEDGVTADGEYRVFHVLPSGKVLMVCDERNQLEVFRAIEVDEDQANEWLSGGENEEVQEHKD